MALYEELCKVDLITPVKDLFDKGALRFQPDGRIEIQMRYEVGAPWIHNKLSDDRWCHRHHGFYFKRYGIIPRICRKCYKIFFAPQNFKELKLVMEFQQENKEPAKCGVEQRAYTGRYMGYSAFWYMPIQNEDILPFARKRLDELKKLLGRKLGRSVELLLKRGCTEMEMQFSPSSSWDEFAAHFDFIEDLLDSVYIPEEQILTQSLLVKNYVLRRWIDHAAEIGDLTYKEFRDTPFTLSYESYNEGPRGLEVFES